MRQPMKRPRETQVGLQPGPAAKIPAKTQNPGSFESQGYRPALARHSLSGIAVDDAATGKYETLEAFKSDVDALSNFYGTLTEAQIENAFKVYQHAQDADLGLAIVGRLAEQSNEAEPGIDDSLRDNFRRMNESAQGGSVLNSTGWSLLMNDAWLLGGLHSTVPFHLASPRTPQNVKGTNPHFPMTVTGRELIGITQFGYEIVSGHPSLGEVARPVNPNAARNATLKQYADAVQNAVVEGRLKPETLEQLTTAATPVSKR